MTASKGEVVSLSVWGCTLEDFDRSQAVAFLLASMAFVSSIRGDSLQPRTAPGCRA